MTEYVPKDGDKVRATLGENTVVGEVLDNCGGRVQIDWPGAESYAVCDVRDGWHFEQHVSVPTKFGAVIRRADGLTLIRHPIYVKSRPWFSSHGEWAKEDFATRGGFTVLFDGVDE